MAKFVLLEVDDDAAVEVLKQRFANTQRVRLAGIFARPVKWCACPHPEGYHKGQIALGARFGLWVCVVCKRPRMGTHSPINLLPANELRLTDRPMSMRVDHISIYEVPTDNIGGD
jgi:hypothetical protein